MSWPGTFRWAPSGRSPRFAAGVKHHPGRIKGLRRSEVFPRTSRRNSSKWCADQCRVHAVENDEADDRRRDPRSMEVFADCASETLREPLIVIGERQGSLYRLRLTSKANVISDERPVFDLSIKLQAAGVFLICWRCRLRRSPRRSDR